MAQTLNKRLNAPPRPAKLYTQLRGVALLKVIVVQRTGIPESTWLGSRMDFASPTGAAEEPLQPPGALRQHFMKEASVAGIARAALHATGDGDGASLETASWAHAALPGARHLICNGSQVFPSHVRSLGR